MKVSAFRIPQSIPNSPAQQSASPSFTFRLQLELSLLGLHRACFDKTQPVTHSLSALFLHCIPEPNFLVRHIILRTAHSSFQKDARRSQKEKSSVGPDIHNRTHPTSRQGGPPTAVRYTLSLVFSIRSAPRTPRVFTFTDTSDTLHCRSSLPASTRLSLYYYIQNASWSIRRVCHQQPQAQAQPQISRRSVTSGLSTMGLYTPTTWGRASVGACPTSTLGFLHHSRPFLFMNERGLTSSAVTSFDLVV